MLGERIERNLYELLEILIRAKYTRNRQELLEQANLVLEILRFQMRLAKDLQYTINWLGSTSIFTLAFIRHAGKWVELYKVLFPDESLNAIEDDPTPSTSNPRLFTISPA